MAKERFTYRRRERTADDIRSRASEGSRDFDRLWKGDVKLFKPRDGENIVRILPATWGAQPYTNAELDKMPEEDLRRLQDEDDRWGVEWYITVWIHYGVGPDNGMYLCRAKMLDERCPICEAAKATRDPDEADQLQPSKRALAWVVDRDAEKEGPQLWPMPWTKVRGEIYARSTNKKDGTPILPDGRPPDYEGYDVIFNKTGKEDRTNYTGVEIDRDPSPICEDEKREEKWLAYIEEHSLPSLLNFYDAEHIDKVLRGRASSRRSRDEAPEDGGGEGRSDRRAGRFARRGEDPEPERERDYMSDDAGDDDAGEQEATPRSRRAGRRADPEPESEQEERSPRAVGRRSRTAPEPDADPDPDPDPDEGDADASPEESPTEQARASLRSLRARRGRG